MYIYIYIYIMIYTNILLSTIILHYITLFAHRRAERFDCAQSPY